MRAGRRASPVTAHPETDEAGLLALCDRFVTLPPPSPGPVETPVISHLFSVHPFSVPSAPGYLMPTDRILTTTPFGGLAFCDRQGHNSLVRELRKLGMVRLTPRRSIN